MNASCINLSVLTELATIYMFINIIIMLLLINGLLTHHILENERQDGGQDGGGVDRPIKDRCGGHGHAVKCSSFNQFQPSNSCKILPT